MKRGLGSCRKATLADTLVRTREVQSMQRGKPYAAKGTTIASPAA